MRAPAFWNIRHGRDAAPMLRLLLTPLGWLYGASVARRLATATPLKLSIPVVSVGNISVGGTGKSPLASLVQQELVRLVGKPVAIVSRGYGGILSGPICIDPAIHSARDVGDEPLMLAADGPVIVARQRSAGGALAVALGMGAIVLDDAHQNPALVQDLSIVVVDGQAGFGNGRLVPAGPLREAARKGLTRADLVIVMGAISQDCVEDLVSYQGPLLHASLVAPPIQIDGKVLGFCGIGRPEKFDATLRDLELDVADMYPFPDHHCYSKTDLDRLTKVAKVYNATLVTTQKDFVRLPPDFAATVRVIPVTATLDDPAALRAILVHTLDRLRLRD